MANQNLHDNRMASGLSSKPEITVDKWVGCINPHSCIHSRWETSALRISLFTFSFIGCMVCTNAKTWCQSSVSVDFLKVLCSVWVEFALHCYSGCKLVSGHFNLAVFLYLLRVFTCMPTSAWFYTLLMSMFTRSSIFSDQAVGDLMHLIVLMSVYRISFFPWMLFMIKR